MLKIVITLKCQKFFAALLIIKYPT